MDYLDQVTIERHASWAAFDAWRREHGLGLTLFTTRGAVSYLDHDYRPPQVLLFGRESAGVPDAVVAGGGCAARDPDARGHALAQCGDGRSRWPRGRWCGSGGTAQ